MKMKCSKLALAVAASLVVGHSAVAQQHVHGQGQVFVAQQGNEWQLQFVLPAADVFGFEHAPETDIERRHIAKVKDTLARGTTVAQMLGECALLTQSIDIPLGTDSHDDDHDHDEEHGHEDEHGHDEKHGHEDEHDHDEDHDHDEEHHDDHNEEVHGDVEVNLSYQCDSSVSGINFTLFEHTQSLQGLDVQWITEAGQSSAKVSADNAKVQW